MKSSAKSYQHSDSVALHCTDWVESPQHDALVLGAWRKVMQSFGSLPARVHLVMGLPAKFVGPQRETLRKRILDLLTPRLVPGQTLRVMVQSQADAPLQWLSIRNDGSLDPHRDLDNEAWGVIEIGHYTTDYALSDRGSMMEYAAVSCPGMHLVYDGMSANPCHEPVLAKQKSIDVRFQCSRGQRFGPAFIHHHDARP